MPGRSFVPRLAAALPLLAAACAGPALFARPEGAAPGTITDAASGKVFSNCREAFAAATAETVLTFSAGVFKCGPEVEMTSDWLILRGAGLSKTFLDAGNGDLTALRTSGFLHVQDLAFGGISSMRDPVSRAQLIRVAVATSRPALFGDADKPLAGTVFVYHSVLSSSVGLRAADDLLPRPLAYSGTDRVAVAESLLLDVESEFDRFPAPGSLVMLSEGVQAAFELQEPARKYRRGPGSHTNPACGNAKNPTVVCAGAVIPADATLSNAANAVRSGGSLAALEAPLLALAADSATRFRGSVGPFVRQPDLIWFDDLSAMQIDENARVDAAGALAALVKPHAMDVVESCGRTDKSVAESSARAVALDRLMGNTETSENCLKSLEPRLQTMLSECETGFDWDAALKLSVAADAAIGFTASWAMQCREKLQARLAAVTDTSPIGGAYLREVAKALDLGTAGSTSPLNLDAVVAALPWIITKTGREVRYADPATLFDRLLKAAQTPSSGDGRKLLEITTPCELQTSGSQPKASGRTVLGEEVPGVPAGTPPRVVFELPFEVRRDELGGGIAAGAVNVELVKRCDEGVAAQYDTALRRYLAQELSRLAREAASPKTRVEAEATLYVAQSGGEAKDAKHSPRTVAQIPAVAAIVRDALRASWSTKAAPVLSTTKPEPGQVATSLIADSAFKPAPMWTMDDVATAVDRLSRGGRPDLDTCAFLMPEVPWRGGDGFLLGDVMLGDVSVHLRCRPDVKKLQFELGLYVDGTDEVRGNTARALEAMMTARLGPAAEQQVGRAVAVSWPAQARERTGFCYRTVVPADKMFGYILVPLGSNWKIR